MRCSRCILHSPSRLSYRTFICWFLPLCRDAVVVFYSPSRLGYRTVVGVGSYLSAEMQSVYSIAAADLAVGLLLGTLTPLQRSSRYILQPQLNEPRDTRWAGAFPSSEMLSVYSITPANWAINRNNIEHSFLYKDFSCLCLCD